MNKTRAILLAALKVISIYLIAALPCLLIIKPAPHPHVPISQMPFTLIFTPVAPYVAAERIYDAAHAADPIKSGLIVGILALVVFVAAFVLLYRRLFPRRAALNMRRK